MNLKRRQLLAAGGVASLAAPTALFAQVAFPVRPVKIVVPFAPGGSADFVARLLSPKMSAALQQPVVIENKAGGGGSVGAQAVARADPDGYTSMFHSSTLVIQPHLAKSASYDALKDFAPVSIISRAPLVLVIHPSVPAKTFPEFLAYARAKGPQLFYGSAGNGSAQHLALELFNTMAGTKIQHVPFKGSGPAMSALLSGEIHCSFDIIPSSKPLAETGKLRALAVTSMTRSRGMPQLPAIHEAGVAGFDFTFWQGMFLPRAAPASAVQALGGALKKALEDKDIQARLLEQGYQIVGSTPLELAQLMQRDSARWGKVISDAGIKGD